MTSPLWNRTVLAMHLDGSDGSTTFTDLQGSTFSRVGTPVISTARSKFGGASAYFNGSGFIQSAASTKWTIGSADFHFSTWLYIDGPSALDTNGKRRALLWAVCSDSYTDSRISIDGDGSTTGTGISIYFGSDHEVVTPFSISNQQWHYLSVDRFKGYVYISLDGVQMTRFSYAYAIGFQDYYGVKIGGRTTSGQNNYFNGYLDDLLLISGSAVHLYDFASPAAPFAEGFEVFSGHLQRTIAQLVTGSYLPWIARRMVGVAARRDEENGGYGKIVGTTKNHGIPDYPVARRVRLTRRRDALLVQERWSDDAGNYAFAYLREGIEYVVTSHDHTGVFNAVIADSILPETMP